MRLAFERALPDGAGVYADWLEERGESPDLVVFLRAGLRMTEDEFRSGVIGQDDDNDYSESGWVACVRHGVAFLSPYGHCSCYGTFTDLCGGGLSKAPLTNQPRWTWIGPVADLLDMATRIADPSLPGRAATPEDCDYDHLVAVYAQVREWAAASPAAAC